VLATKFGYDIGDGVEARGAPEYVRRSVDASLGRLQTDRVDLLYYHWPDGVTPIAETVGTMAELVRAGKARALGVSNVSLEQLDEASRAAEIVAVQNEYSLLARDAERDFLPRCRALGIGFVPYFPLAAGLLTGKYRSGAPPPEGARLADRNVFAEGGRVTTRVPAGAATLEKVELLEAFARARGRALLDLAIGALASRPGVASVIVGAMNAEQVRANAAAADWRLTPDELALLP
jgi:aryl-alcohol dehydrogenase-like predicted oxidoreductase